MKAKCPSCGKVLSLADSNINRAATCTCKHTFKVTEEDRINDPASTEISSLRTGNSPTYIAQEEETATGQTNLSDNELNDYLANLQKSRQEISFIEKKKSSEEAQSRPKGPTSIEIQMEEPTNPRTKPNDDETIIMHEGADGFDSEEIPQMAPTIPENTILQVEKQLQDREFEKQKRARDPNQSPQQAPLPKPPKGYSPAFPYQNYLLAIVGFLLISATLVAVVMMQRAKPPEEVRDPYLTKLLTPPSAEELEESARKESLQRQPVVPPGRATKEPPAKLDSVGDADEEGETTPSVLKQMRLSMLNADYENIIRLGSGTASALGEEERALMLEAALVRAGNNKSRLREIYLKLSDERRDHPNASAFLRTQAASMVFNPVSTRDLLTALDILKSLSLTRSRDPLVFNYLGQTFQKLGRLDQAHSNWEQALILAPNCQHLIDVRLKLFMDQGNFEKASEMASRLTRVEGRAYQGYMKLAQIAEKQNKKQLATDYYRKAVEIDGKADARLELGNQYKDQGKSELALEQYRAGLKTSPKPAVKRELNLAMGALLCKEKKYEEGLAALNQATSGKNYRALFQKGACELQAGMIKKAIQTFQVELKANPTHADGWLYYGIALTRNKNFKAAVDPLKRSLSIKESEHAHFWLGYVYSQLNKKKDAQEHLRSTLKLNPKHQEASSLLKKLR